MLLLVIPMGKFQVISLKMQFDVGSEPYLSTAQALCLLIIHTSIKGYSI